MTIKNKIGKSSFAIFKIIIVILLVTLGYFNSDVIIEKGSDIVNNDNSNNNIQYNVEETLSGDIEVLFCPKDDCFNLLKNSFEEAKFEIKCAFFEFDQMNLSHTIKEVSDKGVEVSFVIDNNYEEEEAIKELYDDISVVSDDPRTKLMHHKFCVIDDDILITGSTNPTNNGFFKNNNNMIKIKSKYLSINFEGEFDTLYSKKFGSNKESSLKYNNVTLKYDDEEYVISSYMCPKDDCEKEAINILNKAQEEIIFANFVLTSNDIENLLIEKSQSGVKVLGLIEKRMVNIKGSIVTELNKTFEIKVDNNSNTMHHKVFVIDERYVITGSMNPSSSGVNYNDENMIVIDNEKIARMYKQEIVRIRG